MKRISLLFAFVAIPAAVLANPGAPRVSNLAVAQPSQGEARVTFDLDEDAVVTAEFVADGAAVPAEFVQTLSGDVNRKVAAGSGHSFTWKAHKDWPDNTVASFSVKVTAWAPLAPPDYMAVDLRADAETPRIRYYACSNAVPGGVADRRYKSDFLLMRRIPAAMVRHRQGSPVGTTIRTDNETAHYCTLSVDYYMGVYEFTEAQYSLVGGSRYATPSFVTGDDSPYYPLSGVFWKNNIRGNVGVAAAPDSSSILGKLRTRSGIVTFDLPTDAQWEYACRAGTSSSLPDGTEAAYNGSGLANLKAMAWIGGASPNADGHPHEVGLKAPNAWGLYDMLGNIREWCLDGDAAYANDADVADPVLSGSFIIRGGCWYDGPFNCRPAYRRDSGGGWQNANIQSFVGFRPMCAIPAER
ncbi:MAG: formylglycine-generating enzyme family protein [Kiritimatiellae bacterium]|nr:formylglycine-generating enzyme family protein [Kiritimatiellia bacterium]